MLYNEIKKIFDLSNGKKINKLVFVGELVYVLWRGVEDVAPYNQYVFVSVMSP